MKKIVVTGGSGMIGSAVVSHLVEHGYTVLSVDCTTPHKHDVPYLKADLMDLGQTTEALQGCDAVVHLAAIPAPGILTPELTFRNNMTSTYNVFTAATLLGMERIVWASTVRVVGVPFDWGSPDYVPIDEEHPFYPGCSYALSKDLSEEMARQFNRWSGIPFIGLRFPRVVSLDDYKQEMSERQSTAWQKHEIWAYLDVRDAAQSCRLGLEADIQGAEVFFITAADNGFDRTNRELMDEHFPEVSRKENLEHTNSLFSLRKARRMLGYVPQYSWRDL
jgi:nucleoside-diphosphate-sugar epimerase